MTAKERGQEVCHADCSFIWQCSSFRPFGEVVSGSSFYCHEVFQEVDLEDEMKCMSPCICIFLIDKLFKTSTPIYKVVVYSYIVVCVHACGLRPYQSINPNMLPHLSDRNSVEFGLSPT